MTACLSRPRAPGHSWTDLPPGACRRIATNAHHEAPHQEVLHESVSAALAFGVLFSGCSARAPEPVPAPAPARSVAAAPAPAREPIAMPDPIATYSYNPIGNGIPSASSTSPSPPSHCPWGACDETLEPLCRYTLDELKLTGIVSGMGNPVAVLESPRGKGYSAYRGSRIGKHGGVVKRILRDAVVVVETWPDPRGHAHEQETVLRMRAGCAARVRRIGRCEGHPFRAGATSTAPPGSTVTRTGRKRCDEPGRAW